MRTLRSLLFSLLVAAIPLPGAATIVSADASDLWWNSAEAGWGVNVIQQDNILFLTLFAYGQNNAASWYVGPDVTYQSVDGNGARTFTGAWYQTTGPYFGGAFNPSSVVVRQVGTATFTLLDATNARLVYTVDGVTVTKVLTRQTWRTNQIAGAFIGGRVGNQTACQDTAMNGYLQQEGRISILQTGGTASIFITAVESCTLEGAYSQNGRMGSMTGNFTCNSGNSGTFTVTEMEVNQSGATMRADMVGNACRFTGRMGGIRTGPFGL